ncbi:MAG: peptidase M14, partial [Calditrichaeota bacterium]
MELVKRFLVIPILFLAHSLCAQDFEFYPGAVYDPAIPTLQQVVGHAWGEKITSPDEMARYIHALADASPRVEVVEYGQTWEGRKLFYLVVSSEEHLAHLQEIKAGLQKLADPRKISQAEAERLIQSLPVVAWLAYAVHGNEISSTDAALLTAYHLAAAQNDSVAEIALKNSIVILDPLQNPDGRDRFVHYFRQTRGRWPDPDQQAAEHNEDWPGGRTNHYLFDMNRDWFALTQPETRGRVRAYLDWYPQVFVDLHEMGSNSTYYFAPPAAPLNPEMPSPQVKWLRRFGEHNARWFDRMKFDYFTREVFDSFYPGYGEGWPMMHGAIGMTYEQASVRGLVVRRNDESTMRYRDSVQHHFISSLATVQTAASQREGLLRYFYDYRVSAIREGQQESVKAYLFPPGPDPNRTAKLVSLLVTQGIEVKRAEQPFTLGRTEDFYGGGTRSKRFPAGTYLVSLAQPEKRLVKTLLAKQISMGRKFIQEQVRRYKKHLPDEIYDLTGWSLPLLFDVPAYTTSEPPAGKFTVLHQPVAPRSQISGEPARLAYLIPWGRNTSARALAHLLRQGIRVFSSDKNFTLAGRTFPRGSLVVKVKNNPEDLYQRLKSIASETGAEVVSTNTSWVQEGVNFGSENVHFLKKPKIAMAY